VIMTSFVTTMLLCGKRFCLLSIQCIPWNTTMLLCDKRFCLLSILKHNNAIVW
jgi:hypothetical protein